MNEYWIIIGRTTLSFVVLLFISRIVGKQTISNMTFHDFATGISMGAIAANLAFNDKIRTGYMLLSLAIITIISYCSSVIALKFQRSRTWISGAPTVIIEQGKILENNMRKIHYTLDSLNQSLREKGVFDLVEVEYAVLETHGKLSVKKKDSFLPATKKDVQVSFPEKSMFPVELIMDGKIMNENLQQNRISEDWLLRQLQVQGKKLSDVFYAVRTTTGNVFYDYYQDRLNNPVDKE
ncbi:DUF421 domain-containing protein [Cohnella endophytica]|uniref:DUF421 domain-containing protein n=1 Tax=Cohnella endophytica TaxID=2419778 RepID=A0A494Y678_9BACL|nr:DUF421 domain-containing protein [Cohnella endophytica]RKP58132.1 DUF421 domain-containing protein [Cohnella endophytica]